MPPEQEFEQQEDQQVIEQPAGAVPETELTGLDDDDDLPAPSGQAADLDTLDKSGRRSWARQAKKTIAEQTSLINEMRERMARLEGRASQPVYQQPQQQQQPAEDPHEQAIAYHEQQMDMALVAIRNASNDQEAERLKASYRQHDRLRTAAIVQAASPKQQQQAQGPGVQFQMLQAEFPQIMSDDLLREEARIETLRLARQRREPVSYSIAREANGRVADRHGIGKRSAAPSAGVQAKFAGVPSRAGAAGGSSAGSGLSKNDEKLALKFYETGKYAHLSDDQKIRMFKRDVLSKPE